MSSSELKGSGIRCILWHESIREFTLSNSAVKVSVVALNEQENILRESIDAIKSEGVAKFGGSEGTNVISVEEVESVWEVKVWL